MILAVYASGGALIFVGGVIVGRRAGSWPPRGWLSPRLPPSEHEVESSCAARWLGSRRQPLLSVLSSGGPRRHHIDWRAVGSAIGVMMVTLLAYIAVAVRRIESQH